MDALVVISVARTRALSALSRASPQTTLAPLDKMSVTCPASVALPLETWASVSGVREPTTWVTAATCLAEIARGPAAPPVSAESGMMVTRPDGASGTRSRTTASLSRIWYPSGP